MLNFEEFAMEVKENLKEYLPEKYENSKIVVKDVEKCNGTRKGIVIMPEEVSGSNIAPNLYLEKYYEDYLGGEELANTLILKIQFPMLMLLQEMNGRVLGMICKFRFYQLAHWLAQNNENSVMCKMMLHKIG